MWPFCIYTWFYSPSSFFFSLFSNILNFFHKHSSSSAGPWSSSIRGLWASKLKPKPKSYGIVHVHVELRQFAYAVELSIEERRNRDGSETAIAWRGVHDSMPCGDRSVFGFRRPSVKACMSTKSWAHVVSRSHHRKKIAAIAPLQRSEILNVKLFLFVALCQL